MAGTVKVTIDGVAVETPAGALIIEAAKLLARMKGRN